MINMIKERKKLIISMASILLIILVGGFTYSYFTFITNNGIVNSDSGKLDIDYNISNATVEGLLIPSSNRNSSVMESVTAKLNTGSIPGKLNIYITPTFITGMPKEALMWEVDVLNSSGTLIYNMQGDFSTASINSPLKIVDGYNLTTNLLTFNIYIWLNGERIDNENFSADNGFTATISADSVAITGIFNLEPLASDYITGLYLSSNKTQYTDSKYNITYNYAEDVNLMNDRFGSMTINPDSGNVRYYGQNPNNYVTFNGELWRIIGVFNNRLKIIRNESIGKYSWDTSDYSVNKGYGINQWGQSIHSDDNSVYDGADLMKLLNPGYENNEDKVCKTTPVKNNETNYYDCGTNSASDYQEIEVNNSLYWNGSSSGKCFTGVNSKASDCSFSTTGLKNNATRNMIDEVVWNLGTNSRSDSVWNDMMTASKLYEWEHSNNSGIQCAKNSTHCSTDVVGTTTWTGKVGLMSLSDYAYATGGGSYGLNTCLSKSVGADSTIQYWGNEYSECINTDWLKASGYQWQMLPLARSNAAIFMFIISSSSTSLDNPCGSNSVRPVVFLKSNVKIDIDGKDGSSSHPYTLSLS